MIESQQVLEWMAEGEAKGLREGLREGQLREARALLRDLLEERFGLLAEALTQRVEAATDLTRLRAAARQVMHLHKIEDLQL